ncbi:MAG: hypothetical protein ACI308_02240 [Muribaculaceae bacterium]
MTDNSIKYIQPTSNDHLLCVNISKTFDNNERKDVYDCARHYWRLNVNRAEKADYVLAVVHGIVKAVFKPTRWYKSETFISKSVRYEFDGIEVEDSSFIGLCVWNVVNHRSQNPVSYINI